MNKLKIIGLLLGIVGLANCGSDGDGGTPPACASATILGTWEGTGAVAGDTMVLSSSCQGTSTACGATFTFPNVTTSTGSLSINTNSTNGTVGCAPIGSATCAFQVNSTSLQFDCGSGVVTYNKQ